MDGENPSNATVTSSYFTCFLNSSSIKLSSEKNLLRVGGLGSYIIIWDYDTQLLCYMDILICRYKDPISNQRGFHRK